MYGQHVLRDKFSVRSFVARVHGIYCQTFVSRQGRLLEMEPCTNTLKGFISDIVRILLKCDLLEFLPEYTLSEQFPSKSAWKKTVKKHIHEYTATIFSKEKYVHGQLKIYAGY